MNEKSKQPVYVVAVSGGVDSVVLLDIMVARLPAQRLIVAHFDHGIRADSAEDRRHVERLAKAYGIAYAFDEGHLGTGASEAVARDARYKFLRQVKAASQADCIMTAHHEDDVFETAIINLLRGTGRKGLSSLANRGELYRPLLTTPKAHILAYAVKHGLRWREDSTNSDSDYLRNYTRINIMPKFDVLARDRLRQLLLAARETNFQIDSLLADQLHLQPSGDVLDRQWFIMLPHAVAREIVAAWLRRLGMAGFDKRLLERITIAAKTYVPGKSIDISGRYGIVVKADWLVVRLKRT